MDVHGVSFHSWTQKELARENSCLTSDVFDIGFKFLRISESLITLILVLFQCCYGPIQVLIFYCHFNL